MEIVCPHCQVRGTLKSVDPEYVPGVVFCGNCKQESGYWPHRWQRLMHEEMPGTDRSYFLDPHWQASIPTPPEEESRIEIAEERRVWLERQNTRVLLGLLKSRSWGADICYVYYPNWSYPADEVRALLMHREHVETDGRKKKVLRRQAAQKAAKNRGHGGGRGAR